MGTFIKGLLGKHFKPQLQFYRFKNKINITKPRPLHYERDIVEHICLPQFPIEELPNYMPDYKICEQRLEVKEEMINPYEVILAREALEYLNNSKMICFLQVNTDDEEDLFDSEVCFKNNGMKILKYDQSTMEIALTGTIYEPALILIQAESMVAISKELDLNKLIKTMKNTPNFVLMAAIVNNNKFLNYFEIQHYGVFQNIESARVNLLGVLGSASQNLVQCINYHQNTLVQCLNQHKSLSENKT